MKERKENYVSMINYIAKKYAEIRLTSNSRTQKGLIATLIEEAKEKYNVRENVSHKKIQSCIQARFARNSLKCNHRGTVSPMAPLEPIILEIALQKGRMNQPLTVEEGLHLSNSLIKPGSKIEKDVVSYLKKRRQYSIHGSKTKIPGMLLGPGYWRGFRARYHHRLVSKRGVQFGHNRSEWCKFENFEKMYNLVYEAMEIAGVAKKLPQPEWQNEKGEKVSNREEAVGEMIEYELTHPDHVLYVDEVGNNTCQKDDGSKGGQKMLVGRGTEARTGCSTSDAHWTTLGFTAGNGEPVLCVIIFASETLTVEERLGVDIHAPSPQDDRMFSKDHYGPGKYFPGGPKCKFRGVDVPCFVTCSPKGSITSQILADVLKWLDDLHIFPRDNNSPTPFLLLDGHGSRLEIPFLEYINHPDHKWVVCIGCPNGTSLWQVGDSAEQNGCFKMYCSEMKKKITKRRIEMGLFKLNLLRTDVIPIVNYAWQRSFSKQQSNLRAIRDRGWGPLNKILLHHPEISKTNMSNPSSPQECHRLNNNSPTEIDTNELNINQGFAGNIIASIVRQAQRDQQTIQNLDKARDDGIDFTTAMKNSTKWTAGIIFDKGKCHLDEEVLKLASDAKERKQNKFWGQVESSVSGYNKIKKEYELSMIKMEEYAPDKLDNLPIRLLSPLCKWKRRKDDKKMPSKRNELLIRWNETKHREDISLEEYLTTMTTIFETYEKMTKGATKLTMQMIEARLLVGHHNVAIGGATAIVHDHSIDTSNVLARDAVLAI